MSKRKPTPEEIESVAAELASNLRDSLKVIAGITKSLLEVSAVVDSDGTIETVVEKSISVVARYEAMKEKS
jgi:hypothetical protein